ncbi:hypothetical protein D1AOALGA4SA_3186 [Olavius algarvensis Delta 1 endosymbiont]|nr:hypothetical protein D1AOALGA4SA_3186 [Olavius algarvensis Delta 1 endosymbiont]
MGVEDFCTKRNTDKGILTHFDSSNTIGKKIGKKIAIY